MTSRRRTIAGLAAVAGLAVSGCTFHPGSAAVVNGTKISQRKVDDLVSAACDITSLLAAQNPNPSKSSVSYYKHLFTQDLISFAITDKAAAQLHLTVSPAAIARVTGSQTLPDGLSAEDRDRLTGFLNASARSQLQQAVIGAHLSDPSVTNADKVTTSDLKAADPYLAAFTRKQSVQVNPAYGSWDGQRVANTDGSLSKPASPIAATWLRLRQGGSTDVTGLPPNQVC